MASLGGPVLCLAVFFAGSALAARAAGRSVWLVAGATGTKARAAFGSRLAFGLALLCPLAMTAAPFVAGLRPFWSPHGLMGGAPGQFIVMAGAMPIIAAQMAITPRGLGLANPNLRNS